MLAILAFIWENSMLFASLSVYGQILFLTDLSNQRITKPPPDVYLEMLPWSLSPVWASVIWLLQPAGEILPIAHRTCLCPHGRGWGWGGKGWGETRHCYQQPC